MIIKRDVLYFRAWLKMEMMLRLMKACIPDSCKYWLNFPAHGIKFTPWCKEHAEHVLSQ